MKHNVRINGEVQEMDFELGSGIVDRNGKEVFEGDVVKRYVSRRARTISHEKVVFNRGTFSTVRYGTLRALDAAYYLEVVEDD